MAFRRNGTKGGQLLGFLPNRLPTFCQRVDDKLLTAAVLETSAISQENPALQRSWTRGTCGVVNCRAVECAYYDAGSSELVSGKCSDE